MEPASPDEGAPSTPDQLVPFVYQELRDLAGAYMAREQTGHTLQPTALVHEAYARLVDGSKVTWAGRTHFFAVAANVMRRVLLDHARERKAAKRGGGDPPLQVTSIEGLPEAADVGPLDLLDLHRALRRLADLDQRQARIVELRFFGGLSVGDVAKHLGLSKRTIEGDWTHAKAWLRRELSDREPE